MSIIDTQYKCSKCEHGCSVIEMEADFESTKDLFDVEKWSNWICPKCEFWHESLEAWIEIDGN